MVHKLIYKLITIIAGLFIFSFSIESQNLPLTFDRIIPGNDENSNTVMKIIQDRQGFLWLGTKKGLIRYDGYRFVHYKYDLKKTDWISGDFVRDLAEDKNGDLWIAIENGGLNRYIREKDKFESFRFPEGDSAGLPTNDVMAVLPDTNGFIWIGTKKGLCKLNLITRKITRIRLITSGTEPLIMRLITDHKGILWMATRNVGLIAYDPSTGITRHYRHDPSNPGSLCDNELWCVYEDKQHKLWIGSWGKGLDRFDGLTGKFIHYRHNPQDTASISSDIISSIYEDHEQRLWITTYGKGINVFDRTSGKFSHFIHDVESEVKIGPSYTLCIVQDNTGSLWVGTYGAGLNVHFMSWKKIHIHRTYFADHRQADLGYVCAIHRTKKGNLLIGTEKHGLLEYDMGLNLIFPYPLKPLQNRKSPIYTVLYIHETIDQSLWLGTESGLVRMGAASKTFALFKNPWADKQAFETICELPDGRMIANVIDYGPIIFDPETQRFSQISDEPGEIAGLKETRFLCYYKDGDSILWIGTHDGMYHYHYQSKRLHQYNVVPKDSQSISNRIVLVIHPGYDGTLWIGTQGGLNHFDKRKGSFKVYREEDGLANDIVYGIMDGKDGKLWIITSIGVSCFDPINGAFRNYDHTDGFPEERFMFKSSLRLDDGTILSGHKNGLIRFHPDELKDNPYPPPVVITEFKKLNRTVELGQNISTVTELDLSYKDYLIAFEFAALNFIHPEKNRYAYMIEGFDKNWNYTGNERTAVYTNLDPGTYTFRVKASNNDGLWNETGASILLIITPPFWKTWWAYTVYVIFLLSLPSLLRTAWRRIERHVIQKQIDIIKINSSVDKTINDKMDLLTERQSKIFNLIIEGKSNKEIMDDLVIELSTLKTHINLIYKKLGIQSRKEAKLLMKSDKSG